MKEKLNLKNGERVIIYNMGYVKEHSGTVVGKSFEHILDFYIVQTDGRPFSADYDYDCIMIPEACLRRE